MPLLCGQSPPKARPIQYKAPLGTRWEKEKAGVPRGSFDYATDPSQIGPWVLGECVGKGASGRVKVARHCETGQMAAVKILPLETMLSSRLSIRTRENKAEKHRNGIDKEIIMMKLMDHPNVVRIYDVFEGEEELFLVLEYVDGGELFDYLVNHGRMEPHKALCYFKQIIYGLAYAHAFAVIHRDLKPENILIASLNPPHVKIADWGMAAFAPPEHHLETSCGSPHYASPEIVRGEPYSGTATDIWSCGVILFALVTGRLPFDDKNIRTLLQKVKSGKFEIPSYVFPEAADLIRRMLVVDVDKRITMAEILAHSFLAHSTSGITYVPAPSIAELDRPLRSKALVKQDLLSSLLLICAGATYDEIVAELLSPPGQGSLIKALYFLLAKHRERTLEEYGMQSLFYNDGHNIRHYIAPPMKPRPAPAPVQASSMTTSSTSTASTAQPMNLSQIRASRLAPAPPSPLSPGGPTSESESPSHGAANSRTRPTSPLGPRTPRSSHLSHKARAASSPPLPRGVHEGTDVDADGDGEDIRMASPDVQSHVQTSRGKGANARRTRSRTQTIDGLPLSMQRYDRAAAPSDVLYPGSPRVNVQPPTLPPLNVAVSSNIDAAGGAGGEAGAVPWLEKPKVEDPELQRVIDDVAKNFGVLVQQGVGLGLADTVIGGAASDASSSKAGGVEHECANPKQLCLGTANTNSTAKVPAVDFRYSFPNKKTVNLVSAGSYKEGNKENVSCASFVASTASASASRFESGHVGSRDSRNDEEDAEEGASGEDSSYTKIDKMDVERDVAAEEARVRVHRRSRMRRDRPLLDQAMSSSNSDNTTSHGHGASPRHSHSVSEPSGSGGVGVSGNVLLAGPAVAEVKGWFANLFNWKAQQYVLHSVDNCLATRDEAARVLQTLGCHVMLEDAQGWGVLRCRMEEANDTNTGAVTMKPVRFRVEFSPVLGYTHAGHLHVHAPAQPSGSGAGASSGVGAGTSAPAKRASAKGAAPFASTLVLVQEKGALSTFKHVHARLRAEWRGRDALRSPDVGGAATPMVGATPRLR